MRAALTLLTALVILGAPAASNAAESASARSMERTWQFVSRYCEECHNAVDWKGNLAFDALNLDSVAPDAAIWEKAIRKVRGHQMPPPGNPQPKAGEARAFIASLEAQLDRAAQLDPHPGSVSLRRLNRTEYANAIREILDVEIDPALLLPRDDEADGFDTVADVLKVSPAFLEQYLSAARQVSVQALGNKAARPLSAVYRGTPAVMQYMHIEGLPLGTRGGMLIEHDFPADGEYEINIDGLVGAVFVWGVIDRNTLIVTLDDRKIFEDSMGGDTDLDAVDVKQAPAVAEINGRFRNIRRHVTAGRHRIGITFLAKTAAESNEILHSFVPVTGMAVPVLGNSVGPRIDSVEIRGPLRVTGVSDTASRRKIFVCRPANASEEQPCAQQILDNIARGAFRRVPTDEDLRNALRFYDEGRAVADFDRGIQKGITAILASPKFLFRASSPTVASERERLSDLALASRLSFFLWSAPPDAELIDVASHGRLNDPAELERQTRRLLADGRAHDNLVRNFAFQWLNVQGLRLVEPDPTIFPQYTEDLLDAFVTELELFVGSLFSTDRSIVDLLTADHTFVNERLALHYGMTDVRGGQFRRIRLSETQRRGLLGKGAFLMGTSYANRTTPVLRGAYILEKFLGTPPTAPPPNVEAFPETREGELALTVRQRLEQHRTRKSCNACHGVIDPLGIALENFNAVGQWQVRDPDAGVPIDSLGRWVDGTVLRGPDDLRAALAGRPEQFVQTFTEHLMTFALGRTLEYYDMPTVRSIVRTAAREDYRLSALVLGIVGSDAFRFDGPPTGEGPITVEARTTASEQGGP